VIIFSSRFWGGGLCVVLVSVVDRFIFVDVVAARLGVGSRCRDDDFGLLCFDAKSYLRYDIVNSHAGHDLLIFRISGRENG
jgi:hypothetical protein